MANGKIQTLDLFKTGYYLCWVNFMSFNSLSNMYCRTKKHWTLPITLKNKGTPKYTLFMENALWLFLLFPTQVLRDAGSPSSPPLNAVCLSGLELQGALWDPGSGVLKDTQSPEPSPFPPLWVSVEEGKGDRICSSESSRCHSSSLYYCPLYVDRQTADEGQGLTDDKIIMHVPLATKLDPMLCTMRHVRITSALWGMALKVKLYIITLQMEKDI